MTRPPADTFLDEYLGRHRFLRKGVDASWLSLACLAGGALLSFASGLPLLPVWLFALSLASGQRAWRMLLAGLAAGAAAVPWLASQGDLPRLDSQALFTAILAAAAGYWAGCLLRQTERLRQVEHEARLLRQYASAWTCSAGSCLEEIDLSGKRLVSSSETKEPQNHWLDAWQGDAAALARSAFGQACQGRLGRFSGTCSDAAGVPRIFDVLLVPVYDADHRVSTLLALSWDVTAARHAEGAFARTHDDLVALLDHLDDALLSLDAQGRIEALNARAETLLGRHRALLLRQSLWTLCPDLQQSDCFAAAQEVMEQGRSRQLELFLEGFDGWFRLCLYARSGGFCLSISDVSAKVRMLQRSQSSEMRLREMMELLPHVFWNFDLGQCRINYVSPAFERIWGLPAEHLYEDPDAWLALVAPEDRQLAQGFFEQMLGGCRQAEVEYRSVDANGDTLWIRNRAFAIHDEEGRPTRIAGIAENVTEAISYRDRLHTASFYDPLSGLPNRRMFTHHLEEACAQASRSASELLVLVITVERIGWIQQCLGQSAKDDLVRQLAQRFNSVLQQRGYLARVGSELFGVVLDRAEERACVQALIQALLQSLNARFRLQGESIKLSACIGVARYPGDGECPEVLVKNAIATAFAVQRAGLGGYRFSHPEQLRQNLDALKLEGELERALEHGEFVLHYQPKLGLAEQRLCGAEALIRWQHPKHGLVSPLRFIHLLEESGLIVPVGLWCIDQALSQLASWRRQGLGAFVVAVNVSIRQLQPELVDHVRSALDRHGIEPDSLTLELTESIMHQLNGATDTVNQLKKLGVRIAVDDFGTGYATLGSLRSFVPDIVKVDKSFLEGMLTDAADLAIVRSVIDMAHALNMKVVAEGVECAEQKLMLEQLQCDQIQGYLLSPPLAPDAFAERFLADCMARR